MSAEPILRVEGLSKHFPVRNVWKRRIGWLRAVDDVSLEVSRGEILGIVGESGCGKSTLGKTLMGIHTATSGHVVFEGHDIAGLKPHQSRKYREHLQYCYQDPGASLDPRWTIRSSLHEPLIVHTALKEEQREQRVREILRAVGLPETHLDLYPHEISGGQQRRVGLARILTLKPSVVILDEPTSGLDVSVQATILNLFLDLQRAFGLTYLFISHDLSVVRLICDRVAVMYLGRIVEIGATQAVFETPRHPYTQSLLAAIPKIGGPRVTDSFALEGEPPSPTNLPSGCRFRTRCPMAQPLCAEQEPALRADWPAQRAACHFAE
ncbi:oligopeptide ABC transporter ATP-binding protein [Falsiroseomonas bella]|uniref:Oligopeptide ABC transporter ATP-binding protein n=1 Tax=Falsiroseomonas bella TaxID=2184016 RepID=A0A317FEW0_9PROT|nr:ABC transporter ATP-binding protein [Falsiroseomonas bella]PWS36912.1 oligopeptide ABC transporter ATP-binding protein [Falsiroseomonas bella]